MTGKEDIDFTSMREFASPSVIEGEDGYLILNWPDDQPRVAKVHISALESFVSEVNRLRSALKDKPSLD